MYYSKKTVFPRNCRPTWHYLPPHTHTQNQNTCLPKSTHLQVPADGGRHDVVHNQSASPNVSSHHQALPINLLSLNPHIDGEGGKVSACRDDDVRQDDRLAKVQGHKATSTCNSQSLCYKHVHYTKRQAVTGFFKSMWQKERDLFKAQRYVIMHLPSAVASLHANILTQRVP